MSDSKGITFNKGLNLFAILLACITAVLLVVGAMVTSNEAGDSVPDWPLSFGRWLIDSNYFVANVRYEYSHRFIAGIVGVMTFMLALWASIKEPRSWVRRLAWFAFALVVAQALVGGVRVLYPEYKPFIAVPHALVAQSFFGLLIALAVFTSKSWLSRSRVSIDIGSPTLRALSTITVAVILIQLVLGAGFRHRAFGIIPHIVGAVVVTLFVIWTVSVVLGRHRDDAFLRRPALGALGLLVVQVVLGISAYIARLRSVNDPQPLEPMITLTVSHVIVGALVLATLVVLTLRSYRALRGEPLRVKGASEASATAREATV